MLEESVCVCVCVRVWAHRTSQTWIDAVDQDACYISGYASGSYEGEFEAVSPNMLLPFWFFNIACLASSD